MRRGILYLFSLMMLIVASCQKNQEAEEQTRDAQLLYNESKKLLKIYTDSLKNATTRMDLENISERFENSLASLYNQYPSETDMEMTEGENDTLYLLTKKLLVTKDRRAKELGPLVAENDSINNEDQEKQEK